jgi:homoserine dehydrogenase
LGTVASSEGSILEGRMSALHNDANADTAPDSIVRVGVLGCGNVGSALVGLLAERSTAITERTGARLEIVGIAVRDVTRPRNGIDPALFTADAAALVASPNVDIIVELIGGVEPAKSHVLAALALGKPVITGNKEMLASVGPELFAAADSAGVDLLFEAAVGGGIPLIRPLRESLVAEHVTRLMGIVNGTTNYILSQMTEHGASYESALLEAQQLGFAEADPTADVEGFDAAAKASILASIAFGQQVTASDVHREGISSITAADIAYATKNKFVVKLLAVAEDVDGQLAVRVHPTMIPRSHPLASVNGSYNAVFVEGKAVGSLMFYGRGAGGSPTASAVLGDIVDAAVNLRKGTHASIGSFTSPNFARPEDAVSEYYLTIEVLDQPGVLAAVAGVFAAHQVSIRSMEQSGLGKEARIVFITHGAREQDIQRCLVDLRNLGAVDRIGSVIRVIAEN